MQRRPVEGAGSAGDRERPGLDGRVDGVVARAQLGDRRRVAPEGAAALVLGAVQAGVEEGLEGDVGVLELRRLRARDGVGELRGDGSWELSAGVVFFTRGTRHAPSKKNLSTVSGHRYATVCPR